MATKQYNEANKRLCDEERCEQEATDTLLWTTKWLCYCSEHATKAVNIGLALGFYAPQMTRRDMDEWEKLKHD